MVLSVAMVPLSPPLPQLFLLSVLLHNSYGKDPEKTSIKGMGNKRRFFNLERQRLRREVYDRNLTKEVTD